MKHLSTLLLTAAAFGYTMTAASAELPPITECIRMSMPSYEVNLANINTASGLNKIAWSVSVNGELSINSECTENVTLSYEGRQIGEIKAASSDEEDYACAVFNASFLEDGDGLLPEVTVVTVGFQFGYEPITKEGNYTLVIPDNFFLAEGVPLPGGSLDYHIGKFWICDPEDGAVDVPVDDANEFTIQYLGMRKVEAGHRVSPWGFDFTSAKMKITCDGKDVTFKYSCILPTEGNIVTFRTKEGMRITEPGKFKVKIDYGYFFFDGEGIFPVEYQFTTVAGPGDDTTAADSIEAEEQTLTDVYNLQGVCIMRNADREAVSKLPAGVYIIGGRKIGVR